MVENNKEGTMTKIKQVEEFAVESMRALARMTRNPVITQRSHAIITRFRKKVAELDTPTAPTESASIPEPKTQGWEPQTEAPEPKTRKKRTPKAD